MTSHRTVHQKTGKQPRYRPDSSLTRQFARKFWSPLSHYGRFSAFSPHFLGRGTTPPCYDSIPARFQVLNSSSLPTRSLTSTPAVLSIRCFAGLSTCTSMGITVVHEKFPAAQANCSSAQNLSKFTHPSRKFTLYQKKVSRGTSSRPMDTALMRYLVG